MTSINEILKKLENGFEHTRKGEGKDLVLAIGNTGVGKSTFLNYMLEHKMCQDQNTGNIDTVQPATFKIGHEMKSETLYATPFVSEIYPWVYTDCPGFQDNRISSDAVVSSISTELAVRNARQVKAVVILIEVHTLLSARLNELSQLMKTLISLFKSPIDMANYSIVAITKVDSLGLTEETTKQRMLQGFKKIERNCDGNLEMLKNKYERSKSPLADDLHSASAPTPEDFAFIKAFVAAILQKQDDIVFVKPLDEGQSRERVIELIKGIRPHKSKKLYNQIVSAVRSFPSSFGPLSSDHDKDKQEKVKRLTVKDFNFQAYSEQRILFNKAIYDRAHDGNELIEAIKTQSNQLKSAINTCQESETRIMTLNELKSNLQRLFYDSGDSTGSIENSETLIARNRTTINSQSEEKRTIKTRIVTLDRELAKIDTDELKLFRSEHLSKDWSFWRGWFYILDFEAKTDSESIPMVIEKDQANGDWYDTVDQRKKGYYKTKYVSQWFTEAYAKVDAYIKTKQDTGNQLRIKEINKEIESLQNRKTELRASLNELKEANQILIQNIESIRDGKLKAAKDQEMKITECDQEINRLSNRIKENQNLIKESKSKGTQLLKSFFEGSPDNARVPVKFQVIKEVAELLDFPSPLVQVFIKCYDPFIKQQLSDIRKLFEINPATINFSTLPTQAVPECDEDIGPKDPITSQRIITPVVTDAGTLFDLQSLRKCFPEHPTKEDVYEFSHHDGRVEHIHYLCWKQIGNLSEYLYQRRRQTSPEKRHSFINIPSDLNELLRIQYDLQQEIACIEKEFKAAMDKKQIELEKINTQIQSLHISESSDKDTFSDEEYEIVS
ncbi:hypothetical protein TrispH2_003250 [Trichoplax sp. H2]|nr:hypothetical protein TrispH2_003250 [Trichoplax sp. H2]|eukprot:RDD44283.1 hypothetical protein TrispH2_003250 [Trichoplax sp. H2]